MSLQSDNLVLLPQATLNDLQVYVAKMVKLRGFDKETLPETMLLLLEEVGELAKAIRKTHGIKTDLRSSVVNTEEELADVLIYLLAIANNLGIDLDAAFRKKEAKNKKRTWQ